MPSPRPFNPATFRPQMNLAGPRFYRLIEALAEFDLLLAFTMPGPDDDSRLALAHAEYVARLEDLKDLAAWLVCRHEQLI